jgi:hypothetical protein
MGGGPQRATQSAVTTGNRGADAAHVASRAGDHDSTDAGFSDGEAAEEAGFGGGVERRASQVGVRLQLQSLFDREELGVGEGSRPARSPRSGPGASRQQCGRPPWRASRARHSAASSGRRPGVGPQVTHSRPQSRVLQGHELGGIRRLQFPDHSEELGRQTCGDHLVRRSSARSNRIMR